MKLNKVILIDDDEVSNLLNQTIISKFDVCDQLLIFPNAVQGLNYFKEICEFGECPELVLLDLKMPVIDGFEFIMEFNKFFKHYRNSTKFILVTSSSCPQDREMAKHLGLDDYIVKPLSLDKIKNILEKHFYYSSTSS